MALLGLTACSGWTPPPPPAPLPIATSASQHAGTLDEALAASIAARKWDHGKTLEVVARQPQLGVVVLADHVGGADHAPQVEALGFLTGASVTLHVAPGGVGSVAINQFRRPTGSLGYERLALHASGIAKIPGSAFASRKSSVPCSELGCGADLAFTWRDYEIEVGFSADSLNEARNLTVEIGEAIYAGLARQGR